MIVHTLTSLLYGADVFQRLLCLPGQGVVSSLHTCGQSGKELILAECAAHGVAGGHPPCRCGGRFLLPLFEGLDKLRDTLRRQGIETGPYDAALHCGYDRMCDRVGSEYWRDVNAGKPIKIPVNYYPDEAPKKKPKVTWRSCANLLYSNWLNYFVYQTTPYDLKKLNKKK